MHRCVRFVVALVISASACERSATAAPSPAPAPVAQLGPAPPSDPDADATYAHGAFRVDAFLRGEDPSVQTLELRFASGDGSTKTVELEHGTVSECEAVEVSIEAVDQLKDRRLGMLNLLCDNGADIFRRSVVTALVFVGARGHAPAVLWEGTGSYENDFDACVRIDVPFFRRTKGGAIQAMQETEILRDESGDIEPEPECIAVPHAEAVLATIPIPGR